MPFTRRLQWIHNLRTVAHIPLAVAMLLPLLFFSGLPVEAGIRRAHVPQTAANASPARPARDAAPLELLAELAGGSPTALAVAEDRAYVGVGLGLVVIDSSEPDDMRLLGRSEFFDAPLRGVAVQDELAVLGLGSAGLVLVDISDDEAPRVLDRLDKLDLFLADTEAVAIAGDYAYVTSSSDRFSVIDLRDHADLQEIGHLRLEGTGHAVALAGSHAVVANGAGGLRILDVGDPTDPRELGQFDWSGRGEAVDVAVRGKVAFVLHSLEGQTHGVPGMVSAIDISDPGQARLLGSYQAEMLTVTEMALDDDHLLLAESGQIAVVDVGEPADMRKLGSLSGPGSAAADIVAADGRAYAIEDDGDLRVLDLGTASAPRALGSLQVSEAEYFHDVVFSGRWAYASSSDFLWTFDMQDPRNPHLESRMSLEVEVPHSFLGSQTKFPNMRLALSGDVLVAAGGEVLATFDVSEPNAPELSGVMGREEWPQALAVDGDHAYLAVDWPEAVGVHVIDIQTPTSPRLISTISDTAVYDVAASAGMLYVAGESGLRVIDVRQPSQPQEVFPAGSFEWGALGILGNRLYLANSLRLLALDISRPEAPRIAARAGTFGLPSLPVDLAVDGEHAFVHIGLEGLYRFDIRNPDALSGEGRIADLELDIDRARIAAQGGYALLAAGSAGLFIAGPPSAPSPTLTPPPGVKARRRSFLPSILRGQILFD